MAKPKIENDGRTITVRVPISIRKRGGRKVVLAPHGEPADPSEIFCQQVDSAIVKAIARAFRWRDILESGEHATIKEIAAAETINGSYIARVLRLTLLAPEIVEAILQGRQSGEMTLALLMRSFPLVWSEQRSTVLSGYFPDLQKSTRIKRHRESADGMQNETKSKSFVRLAFCGT